jgi:hypothetical protein
MTSGQWTGALRIKAPREAGSTFQKHGVPLRRKQRIHFEWSPRHPEGTRGRLEHHKHLVLVSWYQACGIHMATFHGQAARIRKDTIPQVKKDDGS